MTARITCPRSQLWTPATRPSHLRPRYPQLLDGMVLWASPDFGTAGNRLLDVSGHGNHGGMGGTLKWVTHTISSPFGTRAIYFDGGTRARVAVKAAQSLLDVPSNYAGAVSFWCRPDVAEQYRAAIGWFSSDLTILPNRISPGNGGITVIWSARGGEVLQEAGPDLSGLWVHYVVVWDGTTILAYRDGVQVASGTIPTSSLSSSAFYIGSRAGNNQRFLGAITDVIVYARALSETEIKLLSRRPLIAGEAIRRPMVAVPADVTSTSAWFFRNQIMRRGRACAS